MRAFFYWYSRRYYEAHYAAFTIFAGNTERLSIGSHESRGYRLHTISSASAPPVKQVAEGCPSLLTSDKLSDTSDISACSDSGKSTPKTLDTPLTSPPSSPHAASNKFAPFGLDEECLSSRLFELAAKASVITAQSITGSVQQTSSISSEVSATSLSVSDTREQECDSRAHSHQEASKLSKAVETDYDAGSEDESDDDNHVETESDYDSLSIRGVKDGRFGSRIALKARDQTRRRFLTFLRRLCKVDE